MSAYNLDDNSFIKLTHNINSSIDSSCNLESYLDSFHVDSYSNNIHEEVIHAHLM